VRTAGVVGVVAVGVAVEAADPSARSGVHSPASASVSAVAVGVAAWSVAGQPARIDRIISDRTNGRIFTSFVLCATRVSFPFVFLL